jgi:hypothetical protein
VSRRIFNGRPLELNQKGGAVADRDEDDGGDYYEDGSQNAFHGDLFE